MITKKQKLKGINYRKSTSKSSCDNCMYCFERDYLKTNLKRVKCQLLGNLNIEYGHICNKFAP